MLNICHSFSSAGLCCQPCSGKSHVLLKCTLPNSRRVFSLSTMLSQCHSFSSAGLCCLQDYLWWHGCTRKAQMINYACDAAEAVLLSKRRAKGLVNLLARTTWYELGASLLLQCNLLYIERASNCTYCFWYFLLYKTSLAFSWISHWYTQCCTAMPLQKKRGKQREQLVS